MVSAIVARRKARSLNTSERTEPRKKTLQTMARPVTNDGPLHARALAQPTGHHSARIGDLFLK
jgi:hypothetical protein